jgi:alpha-L-fucosidase
MFHTAHSDYSIQNSPYGGDLVREYTEAVRAEGLRVGLYYSLSDWHHPDYPALTDADRPYELWRMPATDLPATWPRFVDYLMGQLTELLTNYGPIDIIWFDGNWERTPEDWHAAELRELVARLQPDCIVNDRLPGQGDYATPEQGLPARTPDGPWELCQTISNSWAYRPDDNAEKSAYTLARYLTRVVSRGGNYLLNIGPKGDGSLPTSSRTSQRHSTRLP